MFARLLISLLVGFLYLNSAVIAQPRSTTLGITIGSNLIQPDLVFSPSRYVTTLLYLPRLTPTHFNVMVNYPLGRSIFWRVTAGYGFSRV
jgi:uncharacterized membrane protein